MASKKKMIFNVLFLLLIFGLTIYGIFHGEDLEHVYRTMTHANPLYLLAGVVFMVIFIWGESAVIHYMLKKLQIQQKRTTCFLYSCVGFFFSLITPSASGGQPMQIYYMHKNKVPIPVSTLVLMIVTITYKSILVFVGLFLVIFQRDFVHKYLTGILPVFYLGVALNVFCCALMLVLVFHPRLAKGMMTGGLRIFVRLRLMKDKPERLQRLERSMDQYNETAVFLKRNLKVIANVVLITFFQRFALFFVTYFVYKSFRLRGTGMYDVVMLQAVISVTVDMLPLPGGMGISEKLFLMIYLPVFGKGLLLPGMVLSRGIAYYVQLLLSAGFTVFAHLTIGRKKSKGEEIEKVE